MVGVRGWRRPLLLLLFMVNDSRKLVLHWLKHYRHLKQDTVAAAELQLLVSSLLGPFYFLKQRQTKQHNRSQQLSNPQPSGERAQKTAALSSCARSND